MSARARLPDRRSCELINFESMGLRFTAGVGRYPADKSRSYSSTTKPDPRSAR
jgi:hypothetical protein